MKHKVVSIGRGKENDIVLNDETVSRQHAQLISKSQNSFELIDLNSTNGIVVNDKKVSGRITVFQGDNIQFGAVQFDWNLMNTDRVGATHPINSHTVNKKTSNKLLLFAGAGILIFFFWFLTKENTETKTVAAKTETKETNETNETHTTSKTNDTSLDSVAIQPIEVDSIEEGPEPDVLREVADPSGKQTKYTPKSNKIEYSISCLRSKSSSNAIIGIGADMEDGWITFSSDEVGVSEEIKVGIELKKDVEQEYVYTKSPKYTSRIDPIFNKLISVLESPRMTYEYYIINSTDINAFTAGGLIFITTGIIDFAISNDELACVIGHEIYHNELGHINKMIRKEKAAQNWFGDFADWTLIASSIAGASFNQENEAYCDMYGVDLAIKAGYDGKAASQFWSRMESSSSDVDKLFSTHPFSEERMDCIDEHLKRNYLITSF